MEDDRPSGANAEHRQAAKTINAEAQKKKRIEKRMKKDAEKFRKAEHERNAIGHIIERNGQVEAEILAKTASGLLEDSTVLDFLSLSVAKLEDFIHARMFDGQTF